MLHGIIRIQKQRFYIFLQSFFCNMNFSQVQKDNNQFHLCSTIECLHLVSDLGFLLSLSGV